MGRQIIGKVRDLILIARTPRTEVIQRTLELLCKYDMQSHGAFHVQTEIPF